MFHTHVASSNLTHKSVVILVSWILFSNLKKPGRKISPGDRKSWCAPSHYFVCGTNSSFLLSLSHFLHAFPSVSPDEVCDLKIEPFSSPACEQG